MLVWKLLAVITFSCLHKHNAWGLAGNGNGILRKPTATTNVGDKLVDFCVRHPKSCSRIRSLSPMRPTLQEILLRRKELQHRGTEETNPDSTIGKTRDIGDENYSSDGINVKKSHPTEDSPINYQSLDITDDVGKRQKITGMESWIFKKLGKPGYFDPAILASAVNDSENDDLTAAPFLNTRRSQMAYLALIETKLEHLLGLVNGDIEKRKAD